MIRHHPSDETLLAHGAGRLPQAHAKVVAAHSSRCARCRAALRSVEELGGALLERLPESSLEPDALGRALARLDAAESTALAAASPPSLDVLLRGSWQRIAPGIAMMRLLPRDSTGTRLDLIRVAPGLGLLYHGHNGFETSYIVQGGYHDGSQQYEAGDFAEADETLEHRPMALPGEDCICLIATSGRLRPRTILGWALRPFLGM